MMTWGLHIKCPLVLAESDPACPGPVMPHHGAEPASQPASSCLRGRLDGGTVTKGDNSSAFPLSFVIGFGHRNTARMCVLKLPFSSVFPHLPILPLSPARPQSQKSLSPFCPLLLFHLTTDDRHAQFIIIHRSNFALIAQNA